MNLLVVGAGKHKGTDSRNIPSSVSLKEITQVPLSGKQVKVIKLVSMCDCPASVSHSHRSDAFYFGIPFSRICLAPYPATLPEKQHYCSAPEKHGVAQIEKPVALPIVRKPMLESDKQLPGERVAA